MFRIINRNTRFIQIVVRNEESLLIDIQNYILARTWHWRVNGSYVNWLIFKDWGISESIMVY